MLPVIEAIALAPLPAILMIWLLPEPNRISPEIVAAFVPIDLSVMVTPEPDGEDGVPAAKLMASATCVLLSRTVAVALIVPVL